MEQTGEQGNRITMTETERMISGIGGSMLVVAGLRKALGEWSGWGVAVAIAGGDLVCGAITGHSYIRDGVGSLLGPKRQRVTSVPHRTGVRVDQSITIARPRPEVFAFWRNFDNLARFMTNVESVRQIDGGRSHWVVKGPAGSTVEWDAAIHNLIDDELIAWRSLPGAGVENAGTVLFSDSPTGGTVVKVEMQYVPPGGQVGAALAKAWGTDPARQIEEDLGRLKQILETGQHPQAADSKVDESSEDSFPASDAPAYNH